MHDASHPALAPVRKGQGQEGNRQGEGSQPGGAAGSPAAAPVLVDWGYAQKSGLVVIDGLLVGTTWIASAPLTYSFPDDPQDYESPYGGDFAEPSAPGFAQASFDQQQAVRHILEGASPFEGGPVLRYGSFEAVTNLDFLDIGFDGDARLRIAGTDADRVPDGTARAYYPGTTAGGDIWFGDVYAGAIGDYRAPKPGNFAWFSHLHEIGHALGLKHPHETGEIIADPTPTLPAEIDSLELSVMSYRSFAGAPADGTYRNGGASFPQTLMMLDIAALQYLYGTDYTTNAGDTRYQWDHGTGEMFLNGVGQGRPAANRVFLTIWDGGGNDTYDMSNYAGPVEIDLRPGAYSVTSQEQRALLQASEFGPEVRARGTVFNALLFGGDADPLRALIEDAVGGRGNDVISGNQVANRLRGRAGDDSVLAGDGADVLRGDAGDDTLQGEGGNDTLNGGPGNDVLLGGPGRDRFVFGDDFGVDEIRDFALSAAERDRLVLKDTEWDSFAEAMRHAVFRADLDATVFTVEETEEDAEEADGASVIIVFGVTPEQFTAKDIVLA